MTAKAENLRQNQLEKLPELAAIEQHITRLQDADYCGGPEHWEQANAVDLSDYLLHSLFAKTFVREAIRRKIPVAVVAVDRLGVDVVHAQYGMRLGTKDWEIIARVGEIAARSFRDKGVYRWAGHSMPQRWDLY